MKKKLLFLAVLILIISQISMAQNLSLTWINGPVDNGDTIMVYGKLNEWITAKVDCRNESASILSVLVRKRDLSIVPGTLNYFCWTSCYSIPMPLPAVFVSTTPENINGDSTSHKFSGDYNAQGYVGISYILYTFFDAGNTSDSISVVVEFDCSLSGAATVSSEKIEFSNAYPNPAGDQTFFSFELPNSAMNNSRLVVRDMLGTLVSDIPIMEKNGVIKLPTEKLNNGIYFYSLIIDDNAQFTKKLIVRH